MLDGSIGRVFVDLSKFLVMNEKFFLKRKKKTKINILFSIRIFLKLKKYCNFLNLSFRLSNVRFPALVCVLNSI